MKAIVDVFKKAWNYVSWQINAYCFNDCMNGHYSAIYKHEMLLQSALSE